MKLYSWNVNGIRAVYRKGSLQDFIKNHNPDILCLQETKAQKDQVEISLDDYEEYWFSAEKKGYSGTAIFSKISPESVIYGLPEDIKEKFNLTDRYGDASLEGRVITLEFKAYFVVSVYTPNAKDDLSRLPVRENWDQAFLAFMKQLEKNKPVIFAGDLNVAHTEIDLARPKQNKGKKGFTDEERFGFSNFIEAGFIDTFRLFESEGGFYTWWSYFGQARIRNVGWRIDYVLVSEELKPFIKYARIHNDVLGSDHCPVSIDLSL